MFLNNYHYVRSYNALSLKLRYYKTSSQRAVAMPLHKALFLTWIYSQLIFIVWKRVDRELYGPKNVPFHEIIGSCFCFSVLLVWFITNLYTSGIRKQFGVSVYVCTNNKNLKEKWIIKLPVNYTSPFKNVKTIRQL